MAHSLLLTGEIAESRTYYNKALALYDPAEHRPVVMRFRQDHRVASLVYLSLANFVVAWLS
jgi:predicted ATPase